MNFKIFKNFYKADAVKQVRHLLLTFFLLMFIAFIIILPYKIALAVGRILGLGVCFLAPVYKKRTVKNLRIAFPEKSPLEIKKICIDSYKNMGMNLVDVALLNFRPKVFWFKRINFKNEKYLKNAYQSGKGIIYLTAHISNWELMGAYLSMKGYSINVVAKKIYDKNLNDLLVKFLRGNKGVKTIYRAGRTNTRKMLRALKKGEVLGILIDQDTDVGGTFVKFFDRPAYTPTAVSQFSRIPDTVVVPGFIYRKKDKSYQLELQPPRTAGKNVKVETQEFTQIIENFIRRFPAQWVWMHPRWKSRP